MLYYNDEKTVVQIVFKVPKVLKQTGQFFFFFCCHTCELHKDNYHFICNAFASRQLLFGKA